VKKVLELKTTVVLLEYEVIVHLVDSVELYLIGIRTPANSHIVAKLPYCINDIYCRNVSYTTISLLGSFVSLSHKVLCARIVSLINYC
jgi:hypothetical protein